MKKKRWIDGLILIILLAVSGVVRVVYAMRFMDEVTVSDSLLQRNWVTGSELLHNIEFTLDDLYTVCLSYSMLFFGNKAIVGVGVNIVLQLLSVLIIYLCIRTVSDTVASAIPTLIISLLPMYVMMIANISSISLFITGVSFAFLVILSLIKAIISLFFGKKTRKRKAEDEMEEDIPEEEIDYLSEEQLAEEDAYYEEDIDEVDDEDYDEPVEYLEHIGQSWDSFCDNDSISDCELGALINEKENTLLQLKQLEEKYYQEEPLYEENETEEEITEEKEIDSSKDSTEELTEEETLREETETTEESIASMDEEDSQPEEPEDEVAEESEETMEDASKEQPKRRERYTSFDSELDFSHYDIDDMTGMDFFDIE